MHEAKRKKTEECSPAAAPQIKHPVITSQSFSAKCVDAFNPAGPSVLIQCPDMLCGQSVGSSSKRVGARRRWHWLAETKPDCLNSDLALPGILLNARNRRTKAGGGDARRKPGRRRAEGIQRETSKDTKAFAKNGAKTNYFWTQKILRVDVSSETDIMGDN